MANILVICDRRFNGNELWASLATLTRRGHTYEVFSTSDIVEDEATHEKQLAHGTVDLLHPNMMGEVYQAFMITSGNPQDTEGYWNDPVIRALVEKANELNLPIAATCFSVPSIRWAAAGKRVTCYPIIRAREILSSAGATVEILTVIRDGNLVTAEHEMASKTWANEFCNLIEGKPQETFFETSVHTPTGRPRRESPELTELRDRLGQAYRAREDTNHHTATVEKGDQGDSRDGS